MAELILKIGDNPIATSFKNGDIIHAMNDLRIHYVHSQHICHKDKIGFTGAGLRPANSLTEMWLSKAMQYKFERISKSEVRRTELALLTSEVFSDKPNAKGEIIHVAEYIRRRLKHPKHLVFGVAGSEVWYGGRTRGTTSVIDSIWSEIEHRTAYKKADYGKFPWGLSDMKDNLVISIDLIGSANCAHH